jgi:hypothetical protein
LLICENTLEVFWKIWFFVSQTCAFFCFTLTLTSLQLILSNTTDPLMKIFLFYVAQNLFHIVQRRRWNFGNGILEKCCQLFARNGVTQKSELLN